MVRPPGLPRAPGVEGLWPELTGLLAVARTLNDANAVVVRITADLEDEQTPDSGGPAARAFDRSGLIGLDVADWFLLGGPTNCSYSAEEAASLAPVWAPLLNQWHLFDRMADAAAFAEVTDERVPEHAPFFAYGIYQVG